MKIDVQRNLIEQIKKEWIEEIQTLKDITQIKKQSQHYLDILSNLEELRTETALDRNNDSNKAEQSTSNKSDEDNIYIFKRNLRGGTGFKKDSNETVFVPENIIRYQELEIGDSFYFEKDGINRGYDYFKRLPYIPKEEVDITDKIISYDYAIVDYDSILNRFICNIYIENGEEQRLPSLLIQEEDISKYDIKKDDIVSIAHYENRSIVRIRWKYDSDEILETTTHKPSYYKEKTKRPKDINKKEFKDITFCIVGATTYVDNFKEEIEKRGGNTVSTDSDSYSAIQNLVLKSDIVVIPIYQTSHSKATIAKDRAKYYAKPFMILRGHGRTNFVNQAREVIKEIRGGELT